MQLGLRDLIRVNFREKGHRGKIGALCNEMRNQKVGESLKWPEIQEAETQKDMRQLVSSVKSNIKSRKGAKTTKTKLA
jgi:hypothetical protein